MQLTGLYEGNGLFAKIIDAPAEEALKHGFDLGLNSEELDAFVEDALDALEWEEKAATAIKWARLYGGAPLQDLVLTVICCQELGQVLHRVNSLDAPLQQLHAITMGCQGLPQGPPDADVLRHPPQQVCGVRGLLRQDTGRTSAASTN